MILALLVVGVIGYIFYLGSHDRCTCRDAGYHWQGQLSYPCPEHG